MASPIAPPETQLNVILVDDDGDLVPELRFALQLAGFSVIAVGSGVALDQVMTSDMRGVLVLDLGLPGEDGLSIARRLAGRQQLRIVALTARADEQSRIEGVKAGVDVYLTKPVNLDELVAVIRRVASRLPGRKPVLSIDRARQLLSTPNGHIVKLTTLECWFLTCLAQAGDRMASRQEIERVLWEDNLTLTDKRLDVLVHRLRTKLTAEAPEFGDLIATQWRHGYSLLWEVEVT